VSRRGCVHASRGEATHHPIASLGHETASSAWLAWAETRAYKEAMQPGTEAALAEDLLGRLRRDTRCEHEALERLVPFVRTDLSKEQYAATVARYLGFYAPLELLLPSLSWSHAASHFRSGQRAALLEQDLRWLGWTEGQLDSLPRCDFSGLIQCVPGALGAHYVLEGAALGGRQIAHLVERRLGLTAGRGASFFHGSGEDTGRRWQSFRALLLESCRTATEGDEIVAGALETFRAFRSWISVLQ